jgi:hypothetical protein
MKKIEVSQIGGYKLEAPLSDWMLNNLREQKTNLQGIEGVCELKEFVSLYGEEGKLYADSVSVNVLYKGYLLTPIKKHYNQNYYKFALEGKNYDYNFIKDFRQNNPEPNYIGKATAKKMDEWLEYLLKLDAYMVARVEKKASFKENYIKSLEGRNVKWNADKSQGIITENGIEFHFNIWENGVTTDIKFRYDFPDTLENFDIIVKALEGTQTSRF